MIEHAALMTTILAPRKMMVGYDVAVMIEAA